MKLDIQKISKNSNVPDNPPFDKRKNKTEAGLMLSIRIPLGQIPGMEDPVKNADIIDNRIYAPVLQFAKQQFGEEMSGGTMATSERIITTYSRLGSDAVLSVEYNPKLNYIKIKASGVPEAEFSKLKGQLEMSF